MTYPPNRRAQLSIFNPNYSYSLSLRDATEGRGVAISDIFSTVIASPPVAGVAIQRSRCEQWRGNLIKKSSAEVYPQVVSVAELKLIHGYNQWASLR